MVPPRSPAAPASVSCVPGRARRTGLPGAALFFLIVGLAAPARAADPRAEELYRAGQKAAAEKSWALACTDFRESEAREHAPGTVLNLADCEEKLGQLRQAKEHFRIAAGQFRPGDPRTGLATKRAAALELRIPRLTVKLATALPADATVDRDGERVDLSTVGAGAAMLLDPGTHVIVVRAGKHADARTEVTLAEGDAKEVVLVVGPPLPPAPVSAAPAPLAAAPPPPATVPVSSVPNFPAGAPVAEPYAAPSEAPSSPLHALGVAGVSVGSVALGVGLVAGFVTLIEKATADTHCLPGCDADGLSAESAGKTWSAVSTATVIGGAALLATGITFLVVAPKNHARASGGLRLGPASGGTGLGLSGSF